MSQNLFFSSVPFTLCELKPVEGSEPTTYELVDTETITLRNPTLEDVGLLNSYIRQTYLTAQRDAIREWDKKEQDRFLKLAMQHIFRLGINTKEGSEILFQNDEGMLYYTWIRVKDHVKDGIKIFASITEWEKVLRSSGVAYQENMERFNNAVIELALLTSKELGKQDEELPDESDSEYLDQLIAKLIASGVSMHDVKGMTIEQASMVLESLNPAKPPQPILKTDNPEEFKNVIAAKLAESQNAE